MANPISNKILLFCIFITLIIPVVSAATYSPNFTPPFDYETDVVHYNQTYTLDKNETTPWEVWGGCIILAVILFLCSRSVWFPGAEDIISVLAWIPAGYAAYASFAVDRVMAYGAVTHPIFTQIESWPKQAQIYSVSLLEHHTIYHFDPIGVIMVIFLIICIANTFIIITRYRELGGDAGKGKNEGELSE